MFIENLSEFLDPNEMADNAVIGDFTVVGIFDSQYVEVQGMEGMRPIFTCEKSKLPEIKHGDAVIIGSATHHIAGMQPDGTGLISLILEKQ